MRRPARVARNRAPGRLGDRPSATTSGREELADGEARLLHPAPDRSQQPPRWSAERRAFPLERKAPHKRLRAYVTRPRNGCRCTRAPVGAPLPSLCEGGLSKPRRATCLARRMMRVSAVIPGPRDTETDPRARRLLLCPLPLRERAQDTNHEHNWVRGSFRQKRFPRKPLTQTNALTWLRSPLPQGERAQ